MRDFPIFTTENGVASITLSRIPYTKEAYITLQDSRSPGELLEECAGFCLAVGAQKVYACGSGIPEAYPLHTRILKLSCYKNSLPITDAALFPVQEHTFERWRSIYNARMAGVSNAAYMKATDCRQLLLGGGAYFVHAGETLLGIGLVEGEQVKAVATVVPGMGQTVLCALCELIPTETVSLEVAENNAPAMALYERLGFLAVKEVSRWYRVR